MYEIRNRSVLHQALGAFAGLLLVASVPAQAASIMFSSPLEPAKMGGNIFYDGKGGGLVGTGIVIDKIVGSGTPTTGSLDCMGCVLNFTTGSNLTEGALYTWAGGGSFTITGSAQDSSGNPWNTGPTLVSGSWNFPVSGQVSNSFVLTLGEGTDTKDNGLLSYFGITPNLQFNFASTNISASGITLDPVTGAFSGQVTTASVVNTPVPVPPAVWLFGSALIGMGSVTRRGAETA